MNLPGLPTLKGHPRLSSAFWLAFVDESGGLVAAIGVASGLAAAIGLTRLMSALLYGVSPADPITYTAAALGVAGMSLLASYIPARRAAGVDPNTARKWE